MGPTDNEVNANECQRVSLAKAYDVLNIHGCETSMYVSIRVARRMSKGFWPKLMMCETSMGETSMQELEILKNKTYKSGFDLTTFRSSCLISSNQAMGVMFMVEKCCNISTHGSGMTRKLRDLELEFLRFLPIWSLSCNPVTDWPGRHSELASLGR